MTAARAPGPATVQRILELACRAPSVHNTQPWLWRVSGHRLDLYADTGRQLAVADPQGRNLTISCGAALHHVQVAAAAAGLDARVSRLPSPGDDRHLATVELVPGRRTFRADADLLALEQRRTDRRRFTSWPIPDRQLTALAAASGPQCVEVLPILDVGRRMRIELLLGRAIDRQRSDPAFGDEQRRWVEHSSVDGVPAAAVGLRSGLPARPSRFADDDAGAQLQTSDGLLLLVTHRDAPAAWLRTGERLSSLWLDATTAGLSVVPLSQLIEVEETRLALQHDLLGGLSTPQLLVRIGWQAIGTGGRPRTPRRPVDDVLLR